MCVCFGRELRNVHGRSVFECECENTAAKYDFIVLLYDSSQIHANIAIEL